MIRAKSCWCSGARSWMGTTVEDQTRRKGWKAGGQLFKLRSVGSDAEEGDLVDFGNGTDGGEVVHRNAAKYKHSAGPVAGSARALAYSMGNKRRTGNHQISFSTTE